MEIIHDMGAKDGTERYIHKFENMLEMADRVKNARSSGLGSSSTKHSGDHSWDLGAGMPGALEMARTGWSDHRADVVESLSGIRAATKTVAEKYRMRPTMARSGSSVSVGRLMAGHSKPMNRMARQARMGSQKTVVILAQIGGAHFLKAERMAKRGAVIAALAEIVVATGRSVEIWVEDTHSFDQVAENRGVGGALVKVKAANAKTDLDNLMYAMAHPATPRRLGFGVAERFPREFAHKRGVGRGYGSCDALSNRPTCGDLVDATVLVGRIGSRPDALERDPVGWVTGALEAIARDEVVEV